jgi:hypothetical protein
MKPSEQIAQMLGNAREIAEGVVRSRALGRPYADEVRIVHRLEAVEGGLRYLANTLDKLVPEADGSGDVQVAEAPNSDGLMAEDH